MGFNVCRLDAGRFDVIANQVGVNKDREKNINSLNLTHIQVLYLLFVKTKRYYIIQ